jgi:ABC-type branched-subunit amino acid transport system substrate-binding protein
MRRSRWITVVAAVVLAGAAIAPGAGAQGGGDERLEATDIGVTKDEIRLTLIADVDSPFAPGLFQGSVDAMEGWAEWMNDNGGLAGREVVVDFIDTKTSPDETRNAIIEACENSFALVGTTAIFVNNVDDMAGCTDKAGVATGLPDFPVVTTEPTHQCAATSFAIIPPTLDCATIDETPQTYRASVGATRYYLKRFGKLTGVYVYPSDLKAAKNSQLPTFEGSMELGIDDEATYDISALAPQGAYTPVVQTIKDSGATYARNGADYRGTVLLRKEAAIQGADGVEVWDCSIQCYTDAFLEQGGAAVEGQFMYLYYLPFEETGTNKMLADYVKYTGRDKIDGLGVEAWAAGVFFKDVVEKAIGGDDNALTRAAVLEAAPTINQFTAEGMFATTDVGDRVPTDCFVLIQVQDGKFKRVFPKKKGTFSCNPKNVKLMKLDLL